MLLEQLLVALDSDCCMTSRADSAPGFNDLPPSQDRGERRVVEHTSLEQKYGSQKVSLLKLHQSPCLQACGHPSIMALKRTASGRISGALRLAGFCIAWNGAAFLQPPADMTYSPGKARQSMDYESNPAEARPALCAGERRPARQPCGIASPSAAPSLEQRASLSRSGAQKQTRHSTCAQEMYALTRLGQDATQSANASRALSKVCDRAYLRASAYRALQRGEQLPAAL